MQANYSVREILLSPRETLLFNFLLCDNVFRSFTFNFFLQFVVEFCLTDENVCL